ncbi:hypothetical protein BDA99DRAFT_498210 [Phascolomyces articulosus]|uniref:Smr domain-containing protein n=1 Tax=Phascolomyces articulosus TaxID=60185 RepID=A0AAD5PHU3_9FUNG|nr:hypothetical protein BDA99DRAFT_498210 [Phascolomyces articulosus]
MGRLQDNQYGSWSKPDRKKNDSTNIKDELQSRFCPPLDPTLIEAIWNDGQQYDTCIQILTELAREASKVADTTDVNTSGDDLQDTMTSTSDDDTSDDEDLQQNLEFLMVCFPTVDSATLLSTLQEQDNNVGKATDILLSNVFLESDGPPTENGASNARADDEDLSYQEALRLDRIEKRKAKKKAEKKDKGVIWSTGNLPYASTNNESLDDYAGSTSTANAWSQYDTQVDNIRKVFPATSKSIILGCVKNCRGNVVAAVREIMRKNPRLKPIFPWATMSVLDQLKDVLKKTITDRPPDEIDRIATGVIIAEYSDISKPTVEKLTQIACDFALTFDRDQKELAERIALLKLQKSAIVPDLPAVPEYLLIDNAETYTDDDPMACREKASELVMQRNNLYRKAAEAYRRSKNKGPGEGGVAFYYSDEARQLDTQAKNWNLKAARALVRKERLREQDDHLVDLHGLTVSEAQVLIREAVNQWWSRSQIQIGRRGIKPLKLVTGVGNHSEYGESKLLPSALKLLKREGWRTEMPYPGCILVKGLSAQ